MKKSEEDKILNAAEMVIFAPSREQKKIKAQFYAIFNDNPLGELDDIKPELIKEVTGNRQIHTYWKDPRFKKWFLNDKEYVQRAEYLFTIALDELEDILEIGNEIEDPMERVRAKARMAPTKLQAIKLMFEITNRMPKGKDQGADPLEVKRLINDMIGSLGTKQLKELSSGGKDE